MSAGSYFVVIKLGAARDFCFATNDKPPEKNVFWRRELPPGSFVIVRAKCRAPQRAANSRVKHGVPASKTACGPSGSIVFRCIKTVVPWAVVKKNIARAAKQKAKRLKNKTSKKAG